MYVLLIAHYKYDIVVFTQYLIHLVSGGYHSKIHDACSIFSAIGNLTTTSTAV